MVRLPFPGPGELLRVADRGYDAIEQAIALVPRVVGLLDRLDRVVDRAERAIDSVDATRRRADEIVEAVDATRQHADEIVGRVRQVADRAEGLLDSGDGLMERATGLLDSGDGLMERASGLLDSGEGLIGRSEALLAKFEPALGRLAPIADRLAETTSPAEVDALVQLIDATPELVDGLKTEVMPILRTFGTVAPDLRDLLDTMREFNEILGSLPGLGRIKRRVEERQEHEDQQRPDADRSQAT